MQKNTLLGSLTVVGTGIWMGQMSPEARAHIEQAEKVLFLVADPATYYWVCKLNPTAESLDNFYHTEKDRLSTYLEMVEKILLYVREGLRVCVVSYGHPGVFAYPTHEAIRRARVEGFKARMLPAVSAEDCLFADVGVDPGATGCQSFEATDFLIHRRKFDTSSSLILWQIGLIGFLGYKKDDSLWSEVGLSVLVEVLSEFYDSGHEAIVYEAAPYPICDPVIERVPLAKVAKARVTPMSTLYIPPKASPPPDLEMAERLGITLSILKKLGKH